jgi:hypothetical protein
MEQMAMETNKVVVGALQQCDTKELVEDTFSRYNILDYSQKADHIVEAMGNPILFFSEGGMDTESRYVTVLSMFLTGEWKMNKIYERMGL